ncbi:hypothetical protein K440DRAFT_115197 [Wilcoxina mikolae CBS 423.85]|nr:hypothetical protein K440DRAFT_115197 [Wilcoxina mikolae CBS 423.85]
MMVQFSTRKQGATELKTTSWKKFEFARLLAAKMFGMMGAALFEFHFCVWMDAACSRFTGGWVSGSVRIVISKL